MDENNGDGRIVPAAGDGTNYARGNVELARGVESKPCMSCRSWEKDERRLIEHLLRRGLKVQEDGTFVTPIAKDIPGRKSLVIDPKSWGYCRRDSMPTDMLATCENFRPVRTREELLSRVRR